MLCLPFIATGETEAQQEEDGSTLRCDDMASLSLSLSLLSLGLDSKDKVWFGYLSLMFCVSDDFVGYQLIDAGILSFA